MEARTGIIASSCSLYSIIIFMETKQCEFCGNDFVSSNKRTKTCGRSCGNRLAYKNGRRRDWGLKISLYEHWVQKFGIETAEIKQKQYVESMSFAIQAADMSNQKAAASKTFKEMNSQRTGKSYEEIFGENRAREIKARISARVKGSGNPSFGKCRMGGKSVKGYYKGKFFRSLLELSFMKHLESLGFSLEDVKYECFTIPWKDKSGTSRTYRIDFYVPSIKTAYEVKQSFALKFEENIQKWDYAESFFNDLNVKFQVVTEHDFRKISFDETKNDHNVVFIQKTLNYFRRTSD